LKTKKILCLALAAVLLCAGAAFPRPGVTAQAAPNPTVTVMLDGKLVIFDDVSAQIVNNRTLVPVRGIAEKMDPDADVQWFGDIRKIQIVMPMNSRYAIMFIDNPVLQYGTYHINPETGAREMDTKETVTMDEDSLSLLRLICKFMKFPRKRCI